MQKNLKLATLFAAIFVILVFIGKYFTTNFKNIMSYQSYDQNIEQNTPDSPVKEAAKPEAAEQKETKSPGDEFAEMDIFNYNAPVVEIDEKAVKKKAKRLDYGNYEDRVRMESPEDMDANGLYVALMQAVSDNDVKRAKTLIAKGARLNSPDGDTAYAPIFWAIGNGNVEMVDLLIKKGVKVNTPDDRGLFPIHWVVENASNRPNVYQMKAIFDLLLEAHPEEINRQDTVYLQTPLMMSLLSNNTRAFAYLFDKGANVNVVDKDSKDITDIAISEACHICIQFIESKQRQNEITPLMNFASTFTAPDPIWWPYSKVKKTVKKAKKKTRNPEEIVIQGNSMDIPVYKDMPDILPLNKNEGPNMVIRS